MPLLVDTGFVYALADRSDAWHVKIRAYIESTRAQLLAPVTILPEVAYLLRDRIGSKAEATFVRSLGSLEVGIEDIKRSDWPRIEALMAKYDVLGFVDATVVAVAERLKVTEIATTDRRHFGIVRPAHVERFRLVP